jgi:hypothetical protein
MEKLPLNTVRYDPYVNDIIEAYFAAGNTKKAVEMTNDLCNYFYTHLDYYLKQKPYIVGSSDYTIGTAFEYTRRAGEACITYHQTDMGIEINKKLQEYYSKYIGLLEPAQR